MLKGAISAEIDFNDGSFGALTTILRTIIIIGVVESKVINDGSELSLKITYNDDYF